MKHVYSIPNGTDYHYCPESLNGDMHPDAYGSCVTDIERNADGWWAVHNGEYANKIFYCPYCGQLLPT